MYFLTGPYVRLSLCLGRDFICDTFLHNSFIDSDTCVGVSGELLIPGLGYTEVVKMLTVYGDIVVC